MKKFTKIKNIHTIMSIALALILPVETSAITIYGVFNKALGYLPTVEDRSAMALDFCGIEGYVGSYEQNTEFLRCIENLKKLGTENLIGGTVSKPYTFSPNTVIRSSEINSNYDTLYTLVNGNLNNDNIVAGAAIAASKISGTAILATPSAAQTITATTTLAGTTIISTTAGIFRVPTMTTTQKNNLYNEENGAIIYDSTLGSFQVYEGGAWAGITGTGETAVATNAAKGIVEIGTPAEMASSTPVGGGSTNASLVPDSTMTTSTPAYSCNSSGTTGALCIPMAENDGKLNQLWLDKAEAFAWTALHTFTTTTMTTTTITDAIITSSTIGTLNLEGKDTTALVGGTTTDASTLHYHSGTVSTGQSSRAINSTGTQAITHSLGVIPSYIQINAMTTGVISDKTLVSSFGTATSTVGQYATYGAIENGTSVVASIGQNASNIIALVDADGASLGIGNLSAVDTTTFTINWTTNPNEGSARVFQWTAFK